MDDSIIYLICAILSAERTAKTALPQNQRIIGGTIVDISQRPFSAAVLYGADGINFRQDCGATILTSLSALSAAHCWVLRGSNILRVRLRVGSTNSNNGGAVHNVALLITHPNYNSWSNDNDIGIIRVISPFSFNNNVRVGSIAGPNYVLNDNVEVWAIGWGRTASNETLSPYLRHVQLRTFNQIRCQAIYLENWVFVNANMMCAGWEAGGRGSCTGDSGSPLLHNNVAVGVTSFGAGCGDGHFPTVYARVSRYTSWIQANT